MVDRGSLWYRFACWTVKTLTRLTGGKRVVGTERIPLTGPVLITPVHLSFIDPPFVGSHVPRRIRLMAKKELFKFPLGPLIKSLGAYPVDRGGSDTSSIRLTLELLGKGEAVLMFPEGTRGDGQTLGTILAGVAMLAKRSDAAVVPVGLCGPEKMWPKGQKLPRPAHLSMVYGEPFRMSELSAEGNAREAFVRELERRLIDASREAGLNLRTASEEPDQTPVAHRGTTA